jgi:hypothetical protein
MTHTQNNLSFEVALIDAIMCCKEGKSNVLLGAADEAIDFLKLLKQTVIQSDIPFTSGTTFMIVGNDPTESEIGIQDCAVEFNTENVQHSVNGFLMKNQISLTEIDQILVSGASLQQQFPGSIDYLKYSGLYFSVSAFAVHLGHDWLKKEKKKYLLIINEQLRGKLGIILLNRDETYN